MQYGRFRVKWNFLEKIEVSHILLALYIFFVLHKLVFELSQLT